MSSPGYIPKHYMYASEVTVRSTSLVRGYPPIIHHKRPPDIAFRTVVALIMVGLTSLALLTSSIVG